MRDKMPKKGMIGITLRKEVAELLRERAKVARMGLNEFLEVMLIGPSQDSPNRLNATTTIPRRNAPNRANFKLYS